MLIDKILLDEITQKAKSSERLRMNHNLHKSLDAKVQRLLNALEPGTLLPIHRHRHTDETYIVLRGAIKVQLFNDSSAIIEEIILSPNEGVYGLNISAGVWHSLEVLENGTVIFEVKEGPYSPLQAEDILQKY